ncbi:MAG: fasciclin domain-containing protein [Bacteroidales bacterium]
MKTKLPFITAGVLIIFLTAVSCGQRDPDQSGAATATDVPSAGQSAVKDDLSEKNVVQVAVGSPDHTTLVAAVTHAGLVDVLSNVGPFTVFAPVDAAFKELPEGTLQSLLQPENKNQLINILEYHVYVGVIRENLIQDGMILNQVNGQNLKLSRSGDHIQVNEANVLGSVMASNGIVYVIDKVLIP